MVKKKAEKIIHLDMDEMTKKTAPKNVNTTQLPLGEILAKARKSKELDIEEIAKTLCIKPIYLDALEKGHYYAFPARSYAIGFLRNYARFLKLNPDDMVDLFYQETNNSKEEPLDMLVIEKHFSLPSLKMVALSLGTLLLIYIIWYWIASVFYPDTLVQKEPELLQKASVVVAPVPDPIVVEEKKEPAPEKPKAPEIKEVAKEAFEAPIAFIAKDRVWVSLKDNKENKVLLDKTMIKNEHFIPNIPLANITVSTGRADVLDIYLAGKKIKTFAKEENTSLESLAEEAED